MPRLIVFVPYRFTAIQVLDVLRREVAYGIGHIDEDLPPGVYRVIARVPGAVDDRVVSVLADHEVRIAQTDLEFDSPAPLHASRTHHEYHEMPALTESRRVHVDAANGFDGEASRLFVLVRSDGSSRDHQPVLMVNTGTGDTIARIEDGLVDAKGGVCALSVALPAGTYVLVHEVPGLGTRGQVVYLENGWETQVFAPWDVHYADLSRALVTMLPAGSGFSPTWNSYYDRVDAALAGLVRGRLVLDSPGHDDLTYFKSDPMLTLVAAYAYLLHGDLDSTTWAGITRYLLELLPHCPDAHLLHRLRGSDENYSYRDLELESPPMFAAGMDALATLAAQDAGLVPASSWTAEVAAIVTTGSVWTRMNLDVDPTRRTTLLLSEAFDSARSGEDVARVTGLPLSVVEQAIARP